MTLSHSDHQKSLAIPFHLRSGSKQQVKNGEWVDTPQGNIIRQVESRLQYLKKTRWSYTPTPSGDEGVQLAEDAAFELVDIVHRIAGILGERDPALYKNLMDKVIDKVADIRVAADEIMSKNQVLVVPEVKPEVKKQEVKKVDAKKTSTRCIFGTEDLGKDKIRHPDVFEHLTSKMAAFVKSGDVTHIVPYGSFADRQEQDLYSRFTMVDVTSVRGKTIYGTKMSNGREYPFKVIHPQANDILAPGRYCILDDGMVIIWAIKFDDPHISKVFNSLYRGVR